MGGLEVGLGAFAELGVGEPFERGEGHRAGSFEGGVVGLLGGGGGGELCGVVAGLGIDGVDRVETGQDVGDVAHVGAAESAARGGVEVEGADAFALGPAASEDFGEGGVGGEVAVAGAVPGEGEGGFGGFGGAAEAGGDALAHFVEQAFTGGADIKFGGGVVGDDVGFLAAVLDDAVDADLGLGLLAEQADRLIGEDERVEGVAAFPGGGGGVGVAAAELDGAGVDGEDGGAEEVGHAGVDHDGCADTLECAGVDQADFAAAALFGGGAEYAHAAFEVGVVERGGEAEAGGSAGDGDQVVSAGVADFGQGVVFAEDGDTGSAVAAFGLEGGVHAVGGALNVEAAGFEEVAEGCVGVLLLVVLLGVGVDVEAEFAQRGGGCVDGVEGCLLAVHGVLTR